MGSLILDTVEMHESFESFESTYNHRLNELVSRARAWASERRLDSSCLEDLSFLA